jgi:hypothetical protein
MSMLVELVMKLLYCRKQSSTCQYKAVQLSCSVRLMMSMLVELVVKLLYCIMNSSTKQYNVMGCSTMLVELFMKLLYCTYSILLQQHAAVQSSKICLDAINNETWSYT